MTVAHERFDHIFIEPSSYDASFAFYREGLGWQVAFSWGGNGEPRGACLRSGAMQVVLAEPHPARDHSKIPRYPWDTPDRSPAGRGH